MRAVLNDAENRACMYFRAGARQFGMDEHKRLENKADRLLCVCKSNEKQIYGSDTDMLIPEIFKGTEYETICRGKTDIVKDLTNDSRKVTEGDAFFCFVGANFDGHDFLPAVMEKKPSVIVLQHAAGMLKEKKIDTGRLLSGEFTVIKTPDIRKTFALCSANYFGEPAKDLLMIGVTGTKGKTSFTAIASAVLNAAGIKCGTIGTLGVDNGIAHAPLKNTTPESYDVEKYLRQMADNGCKACVMEVSSQALKHNRVAGIEFDYGIFTNLSLDHVGGAEHKDFADYVYCKSLLFRQCRVGILNKDDGQFRKMTENATCEIKTYSYGCESDLKASGFEYVRDGDFIGTEFCTEGIMDGRFRVSAPGRFSMYNVLPVIGLASLLGIPAETVGSELLKVHVKGRMEPVKISDRFHLLIDYAHNAVSCESILKEMGNYNPKRIVSLFGCGGNRSKTRRYEMGEASGRYADFSVITEDNSRFEDVNDIIDDILVGMHKTDGKYIVIPDRKEAIKYAIENARDGDIILLLGKGHEDYQEKNGERKPFDERIIIKEITDEICGNNC